ncbi:MAG: DNA-binding response regulator [Bacteroidota bacterium]|nr:MAG: DNA-binding response regulator [Bacteroidota bacterium]
MSKIKVLVVDDHPMVLEGMSAMLKEISVVELMGTAANAAQATETISNQLPDLIITDINMPGMSGIELTAKLKKDYPKIKLIGMSTFNERSYISQMIQSGADGFLVKSASKEEIEEAILTVWEGKMYLGVDSNINKQEVKEIQQQPTLTRREKEVLQLIVEGLNNPQISDKLCISLNTVDTHRKNLLLKLEVNNTASLVRQAIYYNLVTI